LNNSSGDGAASSRPTFATNDLLAKRYRIARLIGTGGAGEVYEALDTSLGVAVALKTLKPTLAGDAVQLERFRREIQNARKVTHLNVCRIFDIGHHTTDGRDRLFLTMELLAGRSLAQRLATGPAYEIEEALAIASQIAEGLQAAHDAGVVHRDLKPANIMLLPPPTGRFAERAVITDFGLALSDEQGDIRLTQTGELVGTPEYMAPEQVELAPAQPPMDVYAFGLILFEMLTRQRPFGVGPTPLATVLKRRREAPRALRELLPKIDAAWDAAIGRCLERQPEKRFQRPADVIAALTHRRGKRA
jgi:serine/threonine protein kinase